MCCPCRLSLFLCPHFFFPAALNIRTSRPPTNVPSLQPLEVDAWNSTINDGGYQCHPVLRALSACMGLSGSPWQDRTGIEARKESCQIPVFFKYKPTCTCTYVHLYSIFLSSPKAPMNHLSLWWLMLPYAGLLFEQPLHWQTTDVEEMLPSAVHRVSVVPSRSQADFQFYMHNSDCQEG